MANISILDCTLRDGGYINGWEFGAAAIKRITNFLCEANVEIIECGFLRDGPYSKDRSVYSSIEQIRDVIFPKKASLMYVAMIALGEIDVRKISERREDSIDGIRLTFHKHHWKEARETAVALMEKGYQVFVQPVGTTSYSDAELLKLIKDVNELKPFAFYLVDTLGIMYRKDLQRFFFLIDNNLDPIISVGFHSHNNLQLSFANSQELMRIHTKRKIIIDSSVYGMGRGSGNLATELLAQYINANVDMRYSVLPLLNIADEYLVAIYDEHRWGYSLEYFLSGVENCHPDYASYLMKKETITIASISKILSLIPAQRRALFDRNLIENLYLNYQKSEIDDSVHIKELGAMLSGKEVLLLASGTSVSEKVDFLNDFINKKNPVVVSVNFIPEHIKADLFFVSNQKRLLNIKPDSNLRIIATSNLKGEDINFNYIINYSSYIGTGNGADNAGAMLIRLLTKLKAEKLYLAGFDGFDPNTFANYSVPHVSVLIDSKVACEKNEAISAQLKNALTEIQYELLTPTRYDI